MNFVLVIGAGKSSNDILHESGVVLVGLATNPQARQDTDDMHLNLGSCCGMYLVQT